jgi:hypothetical protein
MAGKSDASAGRISIVTGAGLVVSTRYQGCQYRAPGFPVVIGKMRLKRSAPSQLPQRGL